MNRNDVKNDYFEWILDLVCGSNKSETISFRKLLVHLHTIEFTYIMAMDENRYYDGISLRYRYGQSHGYSDYDMDDYIDDRCSILEMMVALAFKMEEFMDDPAYGDRMSQWFWGMINSLGLGAMTDSRFDKKYVNNILDRFLYREYDSNGKGSLFTIRDESDMPNMQIWTQMCLYLDYILGI